MKLPLHPFPALLLTLLALLPASLRAEFTASKGTEGRFIRGMVASGTTAYAGTDVGVYRSTDTGATWAKSGTGCPAQQVMSIAASGNTVAAGLRGCLNMPEPLRPSRWSGRRPLPWRWEAPCSAVPPWVSPS